MELGAQEYIEKPTDLNEYTRLVSEIVRRWAMPSSAATAR
jgi:DNA-binding response OmpR family regulator